MTCRKVEEQLSYLLDGELEQAAAIAIETHLSDCQPCQRRAGELRLVSGTLSRLPQAAPPAELHTGLKIIISKEAPRRRRLTNLAEARRFVFGIMSLQFHNGLRPFALPCTGGLLAAVVLFAAFLPAVSAPFRDLKNDVPTALTSTATVKATAPFVYTEEAIMVELLIDDQGRVADLWFDQEVPAWDDSTHLAIKNTLLFTQFRPATVFGQPTSGRVRVMFDSNFINVIG